MKGFRKSIKMLNSKNSSIPATISDGTTTVYTSESKATLLFHSCFNHQCPRLTAHDNPLLVSLNPASFPTDYLCSTEQVAGQIANLDASKSSGLDDISVRMLKLAAPNIAPSLTKLFNLSLTSGIFPTDWKLAHARSSNSQK